MRNVYLKYKGDETVKANSASSKTKNTITLEQLIKLHGLDK